MLSNHGFSDYDRLQRGSPSPMASSDMMPNHGPAGLAGWSGHPHEVSACIVLLICSRKIIEFLTGHSKFAYRYFV